MRNEKNIKNFLFKIKENIYLPILSKSSVTPSCRKTFQLKKKIFEKKFCVKNF